MFVWLLTAAAVLRVHGAFDTCVDRPYYYYDCAQLVGYCRLPHADRIRDSCPRTCQLCTSAVAAQSDAALMHIGQPNTVQVMCSK
jgi:hypothetical protein